MTPMFERRTKEINFTEQAKIGHDVLVMIFDLEGFVQFMNHDYLVPYAPSFLQRIFNELYKCLYGGYELNAEEIANLELPEGHNFQSFTRAPLSLEPSYEKFLGDGGLFLWELGNWRRDDIYSSVLSDFTNELCNRLWNFRNRYPKVLEDYKAIEAPEISVEDLPRSIRFGLACGTVHEITGFNGKEYIGTCINLASRLQSYCRKLGFIASTSLNLHPDRIKAHSYKKVRAININGFPEQEVIVDVSGWKSLEEEEKNRLFKPCNDE